MKNIDDVIDYFNIKIKGLSDEIRLSKKLPKILNKEDVVNVKFGIIKLLGEPYYYIKIYFEGYFILIDHSHLRSYSIITLSLGDDHNLKVVLSSKLPTDFDSSYNLFVNVCAMYNFETWCVLKGNWNKTSYNYDNMEQKNLVFGYNDINKFIRDVNLKKVMAE